MKTNRFSVILSALETTHGTPGGKPAEFKDLSQLPDVPTHDSPVVAATQHVAEEASIAAQMAREEQRESGLKKHETSNQPQTPNPEVPTPIQKVVTTAGKLPKDTPVETSLPKTSDPLTKLSAAPKRAFFFGIFGARRWGLPVMVGAAIAVIVMMALFASWTAVPSTHSMKLHQGLSEGGWYSNWQFNRDREKVTTFRQNGYGSASQVEVELQDSKGRTYKPNANGWRETPSSRISRE